MSAGGAGRRARCQQRRPASLPTVLAPTPSRRRARRRRADRCSDADGSGSIYIAAILSHLPFTTPGHRRTTMLLASSVLTMAGVAAATTQGSGAGLRWVKGANLTVGGRGFDDTDSFWNRLPKSAGLPSAGINHGVYGLSKDSAGMSVRFSTNSPTVAVQYTLISGAIDMWHMPSTGVSGADLYVFDPTAGAAGGPSGSWRWVATCKVIAAKSGAKPTVNSTFNFPLSTRPAGFGGEVRYKLHLPTYNGVEDDLAIGVEASATLSPDNAGPPEPRPIVWYGTSIAQGCCASRPGQIFTNQIARRLTPNRDVINLAFSGSGIMNMGVTKLIATLDVAMIVIDCDWNMNGPMITANMAPLVAYLRANGHSTTPIVIAQGTTAGQHWINPSPNSSFECGAISCQQTASRLAFDAAFQAIIDKTGDKNLHKVPGDALFHHVANGTALQWEASYEDPTVGGLHPSELGHTRVAEYYQAFLPPLLAASDDDSAPRGRRATAVRAGDEELLASLLVAVSDHEDEEAEEQAASLGRLAAQGPRQSVAPFMTDAVYTDFRDLGVHGRAFNDTAPGHYYSRLPAAAQKDVTAEVWRLAMMSTNQYVRFVTDAPTIHFKWLTQDACEGLWHMPTSGACYLDLYAFDEAVKSWRHVAPIAPNGNSPFYDLTSATKGAGLPPLYNGGRNVSYILYLPVRNTLVDNSSFVGVPTGSYLAGSPADVMPAPGDSAPPLRGGHQQIVW